MEVKYYESHITVEPVFDEKLVLFKEAVIPHGFIVADLLMQKRKEDTAQRSAKDTFCTGRDKSYDSLMSKMNAAADAATKAGIVVWRKKIEAVIYDERVKR